MRERCNDPKFKEEFREWLKREIEKYDYHGNKVYKKALKTGDPTILPCHKHNDWFAYIEGKYNQKTDEIFIGPRGGMYRYNSSGRKSYDV